MPTFFPFSNQPLNLSIWIGTVAGEHEYTAQINGHPYKSTKELRNMVEATPGFEMMSPEEKDLLILTKWSSPIYFYMQDCLKSME